MNPTRKLRDTPGHVLETARKNPSVKRWHSTRDPKTGGPGKPQPITGPRPTSDRVRYQHPATGEERLGTVHASGEKGVTVLDGETGEAVKVPHGHYLSHFERAPTGDRPADQARAQAPKRAPAPAPEDVALRQGTEGPARARADETPTGGQVPIEDDEQAGIHKPAEGAQARHLRMAQELHDAFRQHGPQVFNAARRMGQAQRVGAGNVDETSTMYLPHTWLDRTRGRLADPADSDVRAGLEELHGDVAPHLEAAAGAVQKKKRAEATTAQADRQWDDQGLVVDPDRPPKLPVLRGKQVWLYHGTSSELLPRIREQGLRPEAATSNVGGSAMTAPAAGHVFLTARERGAASAEFYARGAAAKHGGEPVVLRVLADGDDLQLDPDDQDLASGRYQYVVPSLSPDAIREIDGQRLGELSKGEQLGLFGTVVPVKGHVRETEHGPVQVAPHIRHVEPAAAPPPEGAQRFTEARLRAEGLRAVAASTRPLDVLRALAAGEVFEARKEGGDWGGLGYRVLSRRGTEVKAEGLNGASVTLDEDSTSHGEVVLWGGGGTFRIVEIRKRPPPTDHAAMARIAHAQARAAAHFGDFAEANAALTRAGLETVSHLRAAPEDEGTHAELAAAHQDAVSVVSRIQNDAIRARQAERFYVTGKDQRLAVWQISPQHYQAIRGVHAPWIAEISPMQYAGLSKREKKAYDERRDREWQASADIKEQWADLVRQAHGEQRFDPMAGTTHPDARAAIIHHEIAQKKAADQASFDALSAANQVRTPADAPVGSEVYDLLRSEYVRVLKHFRTGIRVQGRGDEYTAPAGRFQVMHYGELQAAHAAGARTLADLHAMVPAMVRPPAHAAWGKPDPKSPALAPIAASLTTWHRQGDPKPSPHVLAQLARTHRVDVAVVADLSEQIFGEG